jgi:hypothetical protein
VTALHRKPDGIGFHAETSAGAIEATNGAAAFRADAQERLRDAVGVVTARGVARDLRADAQMTPSV